MTTKYEPITDMISAETAAASLVHHAQLIEKSIQDGQRRPYEIRARGVRALMDLLDQYAQQLEDY